MRYNRLYTESNFLPETNYTQTLSAFLADLKYEDIPPEVITRAKYILIQTIGVSLAAKDTAIGQKADAISLAANGGPGGSVTRWAYGGKLSPVNAAFAAGVLADALDWEDCSWTGHPAAGIIPVAVIAAEEKHKSGKDLLTAIVGAYEVYQRIANAAQPKDHSKGWGLTSWQLFGTALAAAKLYDFDARKIDQTIGVACEHSTIPACYHETTMSDFYHYEHGYRARDGILIAKAVEKGIHNQRDVLDDHKRSYLKAMTDEPKWELLTAGLGEQWLTLETLLKHWPANMWVQSPVEAVAEIAEQHAIRPEDVEEIVVDPPVGDRMWVSETGFQSITHAEFSVPYVVSAYLHHPAPGAVWYSPETLSDPGVIALMQRVKPGPSAPETPGQGFAQFQRGDYPVKTVTLRTKDGQTYTASSGKHPGHPHNMYTEQQLKERFLLQAASVLSPAEAEQAFAALLDLERVTDAAALSAVLAGEN